MVQPTAALTTTACRNSAGSMIVATPTRYAPILRLAQSTAQHVHPRLSDWVENRRFEKAPTFYCLPPRHHKHLRGTKLLERLN